MLYRSGILLAEPGTEFEMKPVIGHQNRPHIRSFPDGYRQIKKLINFVLDPSTGMLIGDFVYCFSAATQH